MSKEKPIRKKALTHSKLRSIIKYKYAPRKIVLVIIVIVFCLSAVVLAIHAIYKPINQVSTEKSTAGTDIIPVVTSPQQDIHVQQPSTESSTPTSTSSNSTTPPTGEDCKTVVTPHPTVYEDTNSMPSGKTSVKMTGSDGMYITCKSGGSYLVSQPTTEVLWRGTGPTAEEEAQQNQQAYDLAYSTCRSKYNTAYAQAYQQLTSQGVQGSQATSGATTAGNQAYNSCMSSYGY
ncbi:MAG TPA: hypothetical protein PLZ58_00040 [Candidatus Saccharibacteria bacterium]|nr:hypothetical protein [Candidatus Saccharibacteria bacterium]HRQ07288.1 hypothetical protein [Candidatus Saccharibacteria bacterium]